ncbi:MAG TPA: hypothetical protein VMG30_12255 [Acidobacteriota bacterium]|nr:hypothetical protein [Acidobacteriota bacterium]
MKKSALAEESGFTFTEFLITACILLGISAALFSTMKEIQHAGSYQAEVQSVLNNTRIAMETAERYIRQAGNDPLGTGISGITIVSAEEMQIRSDITGSGGPANPDKGDPDGDTGDSGESITIRFNRGSRSLEIVPEGGAAQLVAGFISGLSFRYYDAAGNTTASSSEVRRIGITISGTSQQPDPRTGKVFGIQINGEIQLAA